MVGVHCWLLKSTHCRPSHSYLQRLDSAFLSLNGEGAFHHWLSPLTFLKLGNRKLPLEGCLYFYDKVSCSSVCPWTCYVAEDDLKQLIILPLLPSAVIRGILHHILLILLRPKEGFAVRMEFYWLGTCLFFLGIRLRLCARKSVGWLLLVTLSVSGRIRILCLVCLSK